MVTDGQRILVWVIWVLTAWASRLVSWLFMLLALEFTPRQCLPVMLDVGTNHEELLNDYLYLGYPHQRVKGQDYLDLVEEFITAVQDKFPKALVQFEDFLTPNAYKLLEIYRNRVLCFNDDIQGTAAVALAGVYASTRITGHDFADLRVMFLGAGSAATGIGDLMTSCF